MRKWRWTILLLVASCLLAGCGQKRPEDRVTLPPKQERPAERVEPAPEVNPDAVVWRTPEPPSDPQAGDVWVNPKDGGEMVYIAAGEFALGTSEGEIDAWLKEHPRGKRKWFADQQPQCPVNLPGYWIGRTEVTNAQYLCFVQATGHRSPEYWDDGRVPAGLENLPVVCVDWDDARAYCQWAEDRLPSELEWEKAERGTDGRTFPWGNQWDRERCRNFGQIAGETYSDRQEHVLALDEWLRSHNLVTEGPAEVGSYPAGASAYGCLDMAGNVCEWCADWYDRDAYRRYAAGDLTPPDGGDWKVLRGGAWPHADPGDFRTAYRSHPRDSDPRIEYLGFRCARDASP